VNHRHSHAEVLQLANGFFGVLAGVVFGHAGRDAPYATPENRHAVPISYNDQRFLSQPFRPGLLRVHLERGANKQ